MKIFICEDDPASLALTEAALEGVIEHQELDSASDGEACWQKLSAMDIAPDLILLDWNMPRIHGESLLNKIRASEILKDTPVIVVTTSISGADNQTAEDGGANAYVVKLPDFESFQESLDNAIQRVMC